MAQMANVNTKMYKWLMLTPKLINTQY